MTTIEMITDTASRAPRSREETLAALLEERETLAERMEEAMTAARLVRDEYEHAREAGDAAAMATLHPRLAAADQLAQDADRKLAPVARRIRELQLEMEAEQAAVARRERVVTTGEAVADAHGAYLATLRDVADAVQALTRDVAAAHDARVAALAAYRSARSIYPAFPPQPFDADATKAEASIGTHGVDRQVLHRAAGNDPVLGDVLLALCLAASHPDEYRSRRANQQIRSPLSW